MSKREKPSGHSGIHPAALATLGLEGAVAMLSVARDLRSGAIAPENYRQSTWHRTAECGLECCIAGHTAMRLGIEANGASVYTWAYGLMKHDERLKRLFSGAAYMATPEEAARAIEAYVFRGSDDPWM